MVCDASEGERSEARESLFVPFGAGLNNRSDRCEQESSRSRRCGVQVVYILYLKSHKDDLLNKSVMNHFKFSKYNTIQQINN